MFLYVFEIVRMIMMWCFMFYKFILNIKRKCYLRLEDICLYK